MIVETQDEDDSDFDFAEIRTLILDSRELSSENA